MAIRAIRAIKVRRGGGGGDGGDGDGLFLSCSYRGSKVDVRLKSSIVTLELEGLGQVYLPR